VTINQYRVSAPPRSVGSAYRRQVERIAPPRLLDREAECAELAGFCLEDARPGGPYVWWQAGPWAGKSALLSTFVLDPPARLAAAGVRLVSFFVTARLASQDTREAFTTAVIEQLCALLDIDVPVGGDEAAREAVLLDLLTQAATECARIGGRLVLVVDGLDEDRSTTVGTQAHSIAGLLPGRPPAGMRVIVAGRSNPPIPDDVPDWHPLRDPGVIRPLDDSRHARDLQRLGQAELKRLLKGSAVEQDLLGLLTAARGGLTGPDLRDLTGSDLVAVEEILHTVAGRAFTRRLAAWRPDNEPQAYLLGHEELHNAAVHYLGRDRLARYRDRLHDWAESYRAPADGRPRWPLDTPEYLLAGYPRMLAATGDADRLTALAVDAARHERMLGLSGGDTAALAEIKDCQSLLLDRRHPDLYALARLSHHRGRLESRNYRIPDDLPAVWAALGQPNRAEALARTVLDPYQRALVLLGVARASAAAGDRERARELAAAVEQTAHTLDDPYHRPHLLSGVAKALAVAGEYDRAEALARSFSEEPGWPWVLGAVGRALVAAGEYDRAEALARTITDPFERAQAWSELAGATASAGEHERVRRLAGEVEQVAHGLEDLNRKTWLMSGLAGALAAIGDRERVRELADEVERISHAAVSPHQQAWILSGMIVGLAAAGEDERVRALADAIERIARAPAGSNGSNVQAMVLCALAGALAAADHPQRARALAEEAVGIVSEATATKQIKSVLSGAIQAVAASGDYDRAAQLARAMADVSEQARALSKVAGAAVAAGEVEIARGLADEAGRIARTDTDPRERVRALSRMAGAVAVAGGGRSAVALFKRAMLVSAAISEPYRRAMALVEVVGATGDRGYAAQLARTVGDWNLVIRVLSTEAEKAMARGDGELVRRLIAGSAEQAAAASNGSGVSDRESALSERVGELAAAGECDWALDAARTITDPNQRARALSVVAEAVGPPHAHMLLGEAFTLGSWLIPLRALALSYPAVVIKMADEMYG
jgi:tetratricopeptide (TPR) repeat protein